MDIGLAVTTIFMCLVAGAPPSRAHILLLFLLLTRVLQVLVGLVAVDVSRPLQHGDVWEAGGVLEPWDSVVGALPSFLGVALGETPWLLWPPPPLLRLPPEPPVDFFGMSLMHTFLWLCRAEDDTKACFRHFPHP